MAQNIIKGLFRVFFMLFYRVKKEGFEVFDQPGRLLIFANHQNNLDPLSIGCYVRPRIRAMAKKELFVNKFVSWVLDLCGAFPIDRGNADLAAIKTAIRVLQSDSKLLIFPEGTRNFTTIPKPVKPGAIMIAIKGKAPVVPVFVKGPLKLFGTIEMKVFPPIDLSEYYDKKLSNDEYDAIGTDIINQIYAMHQKE
jgi:1-acyl-sn-glycerol-3-phosphate acyltransferase